MTFLLVSMVASKAMLAPLALVNFSVMRLSMLLSVNTVLSMLRTVSLKVMMMLSLIATPDAPLAGLNVTVGAVVSGTVVSTVKVGILSVLLTFPAESLTVIVQSE